MAGTCDHYSIDHLEWLLITTAIALVERYTGSPDAAQEFLLLEEAPSTSAIVITASLNSTVGRFRNLIFGGVIINSSTTRSLPAAL